MIGEGQSGLVIKKFGSSLRAGALISLQGEAGFQARLLSPGWHFRLWSWRYRVVKVPVLHIAPGEIALVVAKDGAPIPPHRILGRAVSGRRTHSGTSRRRWAWEGFSFHGGLERIRNCADPDRRP